MYKENSKVSAGQLTLATIERHSQLIGLEDDFNKIYQEKIIEERYRPYRSTGKVDKTKDVMRLSKELVKGRVFEKVPGRACPGFNNITHHNYVKDPKKMKLKLKKILDDMADMREIQLQLYD